MPMGGAERAKKNERRVNVKGLGRRAYAGLEATVPACIKEDKGETREPRRLGGGDK